MTYKFMYHANEALKVIDGQLTSELSIHRFDEKTRTKAHLFAVNGPLGRQFGVVLGNTNVQTGHHPAQQTRIVLERCDVPVMEGVEPMYKPCGSHRLTKNNDTKLVPPNQTSCLVADELALKRLLNWYAGREA